MKERNLNPVTSISEMDRARIFNTLLKVKLQAMAIQFASLPEMTQINMSFELPFILYIETVQNLKNWDHCIWKELEKRMGRQRKEEKKNVKIVEK